MMTVTLTPSALAESKPAKVARSLPDAAPEALGFDAGRLKRVNERYEAGVAAGEIPGAVVMVVRDGRVAYRRAFGFSDRITKQSMTEDTIFWLASMTKPVTSVAAMILVEEGKLQLETPVAAYLPELSDLKVSVDGKLQSPRRQPTVHDLFRHTAGFVYGQFGDTPVHRQYLKDEVLVPSITSAEFIRRLAKVPLAHEPGEVFEYSVATDVLGRIVEVVSGMSLDRFVQTNITGPLKLSSMKFHLDDGRALAHSDAAMTLEGRKTLDDSLRKDPNLISGGGGLYGNARDYARFAQMLLNEGELDGVRILSPHSVDLMRSNHLSEQTQFAPAIVTMLSVIAPTPEQGQGFGLGFAVRTDAGLHSSPGSVGDFYWAGAGGTYFWIDPVEKIVAVAMTAQPDWVNKVKYRQIARQLVYQAVVRSYATGMPTARPRRARSTTKQPVPAGPLASAGLRP